MIRLLQWLFLGHIHKWSIKEEIEIWAPGKEIPSGKLYAQVCDKCGKLKKVQIGPNPWI